MMRKTSLVLLSAATGAALMLFVTQPRSMLMGSSARAATSDTYRQLNLFGDVFERVRSDYVEKPDDSKLVESAISGMLTGLDPHSSYMDAKSFRDMQVQTRGEFGGLGIEVTMEDGLIKVVSPIDDTPASKAGIMANDIITTLDDEAVQGLTLNQAVEKMRGPVNTKIRLKIVRKGQDNPIEVTLVRDNIRVRSVRARVEGDDIGYIRITTFNEQTTEGLKREIANLSTQIGDKLKGYIIGLRNRRRRAAGPQAGDAGRHPLVRQGLGADHHSAWLRQRGAASHHRPLLHAIGQIDPGQGHCSRHRGAAGRARRVESADRHQGRSLAARPSEIGGRREDRLAILRAAGRQGRQGPEDGGRSLARRQGQRVRADHRRQDLDRQACQQGGELIRSSRQFFAERAAFGPPFLLAVRIAHRRA